MALVATLVPNGSGIPRYHAIANGEITAGAGPGEIPAAAADQLMLLPLPFVKSLTKQSAFTDQLYVLAKSNDGNVSAIRFDATQVTIDPVTKVATARLRVDATALPANVTIWIESHHSSGR